MQLGAAVRDFLRFCALERRFSDHTTQAYRSDLADFCRWLPPGAGLGEVSPEVLRGYLEDMVERRRLSAATVRRRFACVRAFFRWTEEAAGAESPFAAWRLQPAAAPPQAPAARALAPGGGCADRPARRPPASARPGRAGGAARRRAAHAVHRASRRRALPAPARGRLARRRDPAGARQGRARPYRLRDRRGAHPRALRPRPRPARRRPRPAANDP